MKNLLQDHTGTRPTAWDTGSDLRHQMQVEDKSNDRCIAPTPETLCGPLVRCLAVVRSTQHDRWRTSSYPILCLACNFEPVSHETTSARACSAQLDNDQPPPEIPGHVSAPNALIRPLDAEQLAAPSIRKRLHNALPLSAKAMASHTRRRNIGRREDAYHKGRQPWI
jgi:hypothetical protein